MWAVQLVNGWSDAFHRCLIGPHVATPISCKRTGCVQLLLNRNTDALQTDLGFVCSVCELFLSAPSIAVIAGEFQMLLSQASLGCVWCAADNCYLSAQRDAALNLAAGAFVACITKVFWVGDTVLISREQYSWLQHVGMPSVAASTCKGQTWCRAPPLACSCR